MQTENLDLGNSNRQELLLRNFRNAYFYKQRDDMTFKDSCSHINSQRHTKRMRDS